MLRRPPPLLALLPLLAVAAACGSSKSSSSGPSTVTVETRNVYLGGPVEVVIGAPLAQIPAAVDQVWHTVQLTNFPQRAKSLAAEIANGHPDLVGLQEVALWRSQVPGDGLATPATHVEYDFLALLQAELTARGLDYRVASQVTNLDIEMTGASGNDYRLTDRDVVLARSGISTGNPRSGSYNAKLTIALGGTGPQIQIPRGWTSVDATVGNTTFRFYDTHLEAFSGAINDLQAREVSGLVGTDLPSIVVGDFNSAPGETDYTAYTVLVTNGSYQDAWTEGASGPGLTCCHDTNVSDPNAGVTRRVDLVLHHGTGRATAATVVGADAASMQNGLWPSDHAGVFATLNVAP